MDKLPSVLPLYKQLDVKQYFGGYLLENYLQTAKALDLSRGELAQLARNSFSGSFLPDADKARWIAKVDEAAG